MADYMGLKLRHIDTTETGDRPTSFTWATPPRPSPRASAMSRSSPWPGGRAPRAWPRDSATELWGRARRRLRVSLRPHRGQPVRHGGHAPHARVRHHERPARVDQGRRLPPCPAQSPRPPARGGDGRRGGELAHDLRSAPPARLLRHHRRRRLDHCREAGDRQAPQAAAGQGAGRGRSGEASDGRTGRPDLHGRTMVGPDLPSRRQG